jgi:hypothetical protein
MDVLGVTYRAPSPWLTALSPQVTERIRGPIEEQQKSGAPLGDVDDFLRLADEQLRGQGLSPSELGGQDEAEIRGLAESAQTQRLGASGTFDAFPPHAAAPASSTASRRRADDEVCGRCPNLPRHGST